MDMAIRFPNLQVYFGYIPKSFQVFGIEITIYGLLLAVALLAGIMVIVLEAKRRNQNPDMYVAASMLAIVFGVVGARLWYVVSHWNIYKGAPEEILRLQNGGFAFYGALLGGMLALLIVSGIKKFPVGEMADTVSIGTAAGQIIAVWGTFFSREAFGEYTNSAFAMELPLSAVHASDVTALMRENLADIDGVSFVRVHPLFLYESIWCVVLVLLLLARKRRKRFSGEVAMTYLAGYGLGRAVLSGFRTDEIRIGETGISVSQIIAALLFVTFFVIVAVKRSMAKKRAEIRRRRREKVYEEEERMEAELAKEEEVLSPQAAAWENPQIPVQAGQPDKEPGGSSEESEAESEAGQDAGAVSESDDIKMEETPKDSAGDTENEEENTEEQIEEQE